MTLAMHFKPHGMTTDSFDLVHKALDEAGQANPKGRLLHIGWGPSDAIEVLDVWDSIESFEAFGATLMPILAAHGIDPGQPDIQPVDRIIKG